MNFKSYLYQINELSLVKKEDIYRGSFMKLGASGLKSNDAKLVFNVFNIPVNALIQFLGFDIKEKYNKKNFISIEENTNKCFFNYNNNIYVVEIKASKFSKWWKGKGGKADTNDLTELKEYISLILFTDLYSENKVIEFLKKDKSHLIDLYKTEYYESALKQRNVFLKFKPKSSTFYELQDTKYSKIIYDKAKELGLKGSIDNWNPGDVWGFTKTGIDRLNKLNFKTILELNDFLRENFNSRDIIAISLKHIKPKNKAHIDIIDPANRPKTDKSFKLTRIKIPEEGTYKSIFFETVDKISLKGNMRASSTTTV
jgi:hypothetical protein